MSDIKDFADRVAAHKAKTEARDAPVAQPGSFEEKYATMIIELVQWIDAEHAQLLRIWNRCRDTNPNHARHVKAKAEGLRAVMAKLKELDKGH